MIKALLGTWRGRFIAAFILIQLVLPLHYYTVRHDRHDERFAWRMFSPLRMMVCSDPDDAQLPLTAYHRPPRFMIGGKRVVLDNEFHEAWSELAKRGRYAVLEKIGSTLCAVHRPEPVTLSMTCTYLDGKRETFSAIDLCAHPEL